MLMFNIKKEIKKIKSKGVPTHVGIIMDGNRRWGRRKRGNALLGHVAGKKRLKDIINITKELGIKYLTLYTFSSENLKKRPKKEKENLFNLLKEGFEEIVNDKEIYKEKVKVSVFGRINKLPEGVQKKIKNAINKTKKHSKYFLNFCIVYDGQEEIVDAVKEIVKKKIKKITKNTIKKYLYTKDIPAPDLIIRTGMEKGKRLSSFLLWDSSYSEFYFTKTLWPDFNKKEFIKAIKDFQNRKRRFGA